MRWWCRQCTQRQQGRSRRRWHVMKYIIILRSIALAACGENQSNDDPVRHVNEQGGEHTRFGSNQRVASLGARRAHLGAVWCAPQDLELTLRHWNRAYRRPGESRHVGLRDFAVHAECTGSQKGDLESLAARDRRERSMLGDGSAPCSRLGGWGSRSAVEQPGGTEINTMCWMIVDLDLQRGHIRPTAWMGSSAARNLGCHGGPLFAVAMVFMQDRPASGPSSASAPTGPSPRSSEPLTPVSRNSPFPK